MSKSKELSASFLVQYHLQEQQLRCPDPSTASFSTED